MKSHKKTPRTFVGPLLGASALALCMAGSPATQAGTDVFIGELMLVGYTFCPRGTANADGQLLAISSNSALFSLYGTTFGGDGRTTFGLPDLRGRSVVGQGSGPGLIGKTVGQKSGAESTTLNATQMPSHNHTAAAAVTLHAKNGAGNSASPEGNVLAVKSRTKIYSSGAPDVIMGNEENVAITAEVTVDNAGGGQAFSLRDPYLVMRYCVSLQGVYPSRN